MKPNFIKFGLLLKGVIALENTTTMQNALGRGVIKKECYKKGGDT